MIVRVLMVDPHDRMADWELSLTTTAQCQEKESDHIAVAHKKIKIQSMSLLNACHFFTIVKLKTHK